jgi:hypothetical protein
MDKKEIVFYFAALVILSAVLFFITDYTGFSINPSAVSQEGVYEAGELANLSSSNADSSEVSSMNNSGIRMISYGIFVFIIVAGIFFILRGRNKKEDASGKKVSSKNGWLLSKEEEED